MTTGNPFQDGPFLSAALLCERVLEEKDGVKTAVRIVDRVTHTVAVPNPPEQMQPFDYQVYLLIKLKAGRARGPYVLEIRLSKPSGESPTPLRQTVLFEGEDDRGVDFVGNMHVRFDQTGVYWFQVSLNGTRLTQIPFRVVYIPQFIQIGGPGADQHPPPTP